MYNLLVLILKKKIETLFITFFKKNNFSDIFLHLCKFCCNIQSNKMPMYAKEHV